MQRKTETKVIDHPVLGPVSYKITAMDAKQGRTIFVHLMKVMGPMVKAKTDLSTALTQLDTNDVDILCDAFAKSTTISYTDPTAGGAESKGVQLSIVFGEHFSAAYKTMFMWLSACAELNYGDFLGEARKQSAQGLGSQTAQ